MNAKSSRLPYIDCIRVFACFLVVAVHCNFMPADPSDRIWSQILGVIGSPSSELFLAISGSLLIPVSISQTQFFKRRFAKLLPPLVFWSLFGIWFLYATGSLNESITVKIFSIPVRNAIVPVYWFMYTIIGMYLLAPVLSPYLSDKQRSRGGYLLALWVISLALPLSNLIYPGFYDTSSNMSGILYNFSGYTGYMVLGWYLRTYPVWFVGKKLGWIYPALALFVIAGAIAGIGVIAPEYRGYVMDNLSLGNMIYVVVLFTLIQSIFQKENIITKTAKKMTNYTFGIYLIHTFVIYAVYAIIPRDSYPTVLQLPIMAVTCFAISYSIVWLCSHVKGIRWIMQGFRISH